MSEPTAAALPRLGGQAVGSVGVVGQAIGAVAVTGNAAGTVSVTLEQLAHRVALLEATVAELLAAIGMPHAAKVFERLDAIDADAKAEAEAEKPAR